MRRLIPFALVFLLVCFAGVAIAQQGPPPIGTPGTTYTGTSPIVVSGTAISCPTCGTGAGNVTGSSLTSNAVIIGGGSSTISAISADTTTTHALFATAGAPAFRAIVAGDIPTLNQNTTGSAASLSVSGQTGLITLTGITSSNRVKTVRDAADTLLELGGSYTPTGTWTSMTLAGGALSGTFSGSPTLSGLPVFSGGISNTTNGATSAPAETLSGTLNTGNATTSFPLWYYNCNGSTGPTTFSTNGTVLGMNTCTGFTGKFLDFHLNGAASAFTVDQTGAVSSGGVTSSGSVFSGASSGMGPNGRTQIRSAADGRFAVNNNANGSLGLTRFTFGTEAATNPAFVISNTILDIADGAGTTTFGNTTLESANGNKAFVTGDFTTAANTSLQAITGLTFNFPATAHNWVFECDLMYSQATANAAVAFGIQAATNAPTNINATGTEQTNTTAYAGGSLNGLTTTTATNIVSATPGATATVFNVHLGGTLELGASANAVSFLVSTATSGDAVTVKRGSACRIF